MQKKHNINIVFHNYKIKCTQNQASGLLQSKMCIVEMPTPMPNIVVVGDFNLPNFNSLSATGDRGRQPPPSSAPTRGDQSRHNNS